MATWLKDKHGNRCSVEYFGSEAKAQAALDSLKGCTGCINCDNCSECEDCCDCVDCANCSRCDDCANVARCFTCSGEVGDYTPPAARGPDGCAA